MPIAHNYLRTRVRLDHIAANYKRLAGFGGRVLAVIKADAYGHGLLETARVLTGAGCDGFAVGSVAEGAALRSAIPRAAIVSLLGPVLPEDDAMILGHSIIPFIHDLGQLERLAGRAAKKRVKARVALKFDTGMARLGFVEADVPQLLRRLADMPAIEVAMVGSHLATADEPAAFAFVTEQGEAFGRICSALRTAGLNFEGSLCNSAGILAHAGLFGFETRRAGIALYGVNPFLGTDRETLGQGLAAAMETVTRIVSVHDVAAGRSVSYGRTFTAERDMRVAVVAAGYADAYSRNLSNTGAMCLAGKRVPIVGRVCMQLTAVDVTGIACAPGDVIHLLGGEGPEAVTANDLAGWWGTIPYEVLCLFGLNPREYV
uniref:Alanine racemase n=1 Tax=Desulfovibrio sp. U5L TaxID=596152 RepID=I2Q364_9BACT